MKIRFCQVYLVPCKNAWGNTDCGVYTSCMEEPIEKNCKTLLEIDEDGKVKSNE